ncbi:histone-lysine N-methyltransferase SETD1A-like [Portunus trituberculatus]|uniref:histone-lysine N-methyltransferase SETD1A-like n=1 Tax=Portunus trituberculatus TaxID=210409 RepID=UPI001E1D1392|nr:histone-lysine N-methyltransferase SETD1A-like [Portunus trituberculatus]
MQARPSREYVEVATVAVAVEGLNSLAELRLSTQLSKQNKADKRQVILKSWTSCRLSGNAVAGAASVEASQPSTTDVNSQPPEISASYQRKPWIETTFWCLFGITSILLLRQGKRVKVPLYQVSELEYFILSEDPGGDEVGVVRVCHHPLCLEPPLPTTQCKTPPLPTFTTTRPQPSTSAFPSQPSTSGSPHSPPPLPFPHSPPPPASPHSPPPLPFPHSPPPPASPHSPSPPPFPHSPPPLPSQHHHPRDSGRNLPNCNKKKKNVIEYKK